MAGKGTYGAYQQLTPIKTDFGDSTERYARGMVSIDQRNQDREFRDKQLAAQQQSAALKARQDQYNKDRDYRLKISQELSKEMAALQPVTTGVSSIDEINAQYFTQSTAELGAIHNAIMSDPRNYNNPELLNRRNNINNSPKIIEAFQKTLTTGYQELTKGIQDGTLSRANEAEMDKMEALLGPVENENGERAYRFTYKNHPKTGQLMVYGYDAKDRQFKISAPSVIQGFELSDRIPLVKKDDYVEKKLDLIGKTQRVANVAGGTATVQRWDSKMQDLVTNMVEAELTDGKKPSNTAKSLWVDGYGNDPDSVVNTAELIQRVVNEVRTGYDETVTGFKSSSDDYTSELNKGRGKRAAEVEQLQSQIFPMIDSKTGKPVEVIPDSAIGSIVPGKEGDIRKATGFNIPSLEFEMGPGGKTRIDQLYLDKSTGEIIARGSQLRGKVSTPASKKNYLTGTTSNDATPVWDPFTASDTMISEIANELGFKNEPELRGFLEGLQVANTGPAQGNLNELPD